MTLTTRFVAGPWDAKVSLGRMRDPSDPAQLNLPTEASGPDTIPVKASGGEYRRTSAAGAEMDVYEWRADGVGHTDDLVDLKPDGSEAA